MGNIFGKIIPKPIRQKINYWPRDTYEYLCGKRGRLTPPKGKIFIGNSKEFKQTGQEFFKYFTELAELKPHHKVLDVGCGIGRMAIPLTEYLETEGSYEGFDIVHSGIEWCAKNITPRFPNFHFQVADIYNKKYNLKGKFKSSEYIFPFEVSSFDFVFLTSVFTHMLPEDLEHYLKQISRVLKKDAKSLITFFLLNDDSLKLIQNGSSDRNFQYEIGPCKAADKEISEKALAYDESFIRTLYKKYNLQITEPIRYGSWCKRTNPLSYQDIIIAEKQ